MILETCWKPLISYRILLNKKIFFNYSTLIPLFCMWKPTFRHFIRAYLYLCKCKIHSDKYLSYFSTKRCMHRVGMPFYRFVHDLRIELKSYVFIYWRVHIVLYIVSIIIWRMLTWRWWSISPMGGWISFGSYLTLCRVIAMMKVAKFFFFYFHYYLSFSE